MINLLIVQKLPKIKSVNEPPHDKTNEMTVHPAKSQIRLGICLVWSVFTVRMRKAWVLSYPFERTAKTLIRLARCLG